MNKNIKLATFSVAVVAGLLGTYLMGYLPKQIAEPTADIAQVTPDTPVLAQTTQPQASGEQTAPQEAVFDPENVDPDSIDWEGMRARYNIIGKDPMLLRISRDYTPQEIAAFNQLHVLPFNPQVGEDCGPETIFDPDVGQIDTYGCTPVLEFPEHPYSELPTEELIALAETDAEAAVFASRRVQGVEEQMRFAFRAAALSGKSGPIMELATSEFSPPDSIDQISNVSSSVRENYILDVTHRIILEQVAEALGDPRANSENWRKRIADFAKSAELQREVLDALNKRTKQVLGNLIEIERQTTGKSIVWEKINA